MFWNWLALVCLLLDSCSPNSAYRQKDGSSAAVEFIGTITVNNSDASSNQTEAKEDAMLDDLLHSQMAVINQSMPPPVQMLNCKIPFGKRPAMASWSLRQTRVEGRKLTYQMERSDEGDEAHNVESNENQIVTRAKSMWSAMRRKLTTETLVTVSLPESNCIDICAMLLHPMSLSGEITGMDPVMRTLEQAAIAKGMPSLFFLRETFAGAVTEYKQVLSAARFSLGCNSFVLMGYSTGAAVAAEILGEFSEPAMHRTSETIKVKGFVGVSPPVSWAGALVGKYGWYRMTAMEKASVPKYLVWGIDDKWGPPSESDVLKKYGVPENHTLRVEGEDHFWRKRGSLKILARQVEEWLQEILS